MVYRIFVEKKPGQTHEADKLLKDVQEFLQISALESVRVINRYDVENIDEALFENAVRNVFSEPQVDNTYSELNAEGIVFAVEPLPGQFDQRADSAAQCIQIISQGERPLVRTAKVYILTGVLTAEEIAAIRKYVINPVECREAALEKPETLVMQYEIPQSVATVDGFLELDRAGLEAMAKNLGLAMDAGDLEFCQGYFKTEGRNPTITEIRMIDTYWSDHCRHTTFNTIIDNVSFADPLLQSAWQEYLDTRVELNRTKPITLMDIGTLAGKWLRKNGMLDKLYEQNLTYFKELSMYIAAGKKRLAEVRAGELKQLQEKAAMTGDAQDAQAAKDLGALCDRFEKKLHDLELTRMVSIQMAPQIRLIQNGDTLMAEKIQSTINNTIPLWKNQMVLALGLAHSKAAVEAQREVSDLTNELLKKNAEALKTGTVAIAEESERSIVDIETVRYTNEQLISTLDEVLRIADEGRAKRLAAENEMIMIENELKTKLLDIRK